jgi:hypothetical protein
VCPETFGALRLRIWEPRDNVGHAKSPNFRPMFASLEALYECRNGWLGREDSNLKMVNWVVQPINFRPTEQQSCSDLTGFHA